MNGTARVLAGAARVGFEETRAAFTLQSWLFGWVARATAQVLFFAAMGLLVGSEEFIPYAFLGNVVAAAALNALAVGPDTAAERFNGTLPLLVAAPRSLLPVFAGRSLFHVVQGTVEASIIFALLAPFIGAPSRWWWLPAGLLIVVLGAYGMGLFLAAVSIDRYRIANLVFNLTFYLLVAIGGVNVPTSVFPGWVQSVAKALPLHHGLLGTRELVDLGWSRNVATRFALELLVGTGWLGLGLIGFRFSSEAGRRDGSIDFAE
jgi:ABC-2 type transport system permease protein